MKNKLIRGIIFGVAFGVIDIIPMFFMEFDSLIVAIAGAFFSRFAIGFLIANSSLPFHGVISGLIIGVLVSLPDAIVTGAVLPIMTTGILGGALLGYLNQRLEGK
ncbi:MAG: hypothetical protein KDE46_05735 [Caldilineaceae bacterium]|nr:hypothetical protein [Caldilineaceae bacterium]